MAKKKKKRRKLKRKKRRAPKRRKKVKRKKHKVRRTKRPKRKKKAKRKKRRAPKRRKVKRPKRKTKKKKKSRSKASRSSASKLGKILMPTLDLEEHAATTTPYEYQMIKDKAFTDLSHGSNIYAWIGAGQCGGRLVKSFYDLGYKKNIVVNTTTSDLELLEIPKEHKLLMDIGKMGAGKNMARGKEAITKYKQEVMHLMEKMYGTNVNHIMVCFGAGGGTGSGSAVEIVETAKKYARHIGVAEAGKHVGVILTLPTTGEASSPLVSQNDYAVVSELGRMAQEGKLSPLIVVDNQKIQTMYPGLTVKEFWPTINDTVAGLFDVFNKVSAMSSPYTSFDAGDYNSIMSAGGCTIMGLTRVNNFKDRFTLSEALRLNLEKTLLAGGFDLATATTAGCVVVGGRKLMANLPGLQDNINYAFDVMADLTGNATIHRGIYEDDKPSLRVYTIIGGLEMPTKRLLELK